MFVYIPQLMIHMAIYTLPFTLQLCYKPLHITIYLEVMLQASWHIAVGN